MEQVLNIMRSIMALVASHRDVASKFAHKYVPDIFYYLRSR
jgi:hypothetical protein